MSDEKRSRDEILADLERVNQKSNRAQESRSQKAGDKKINRTHEDLDWQHLDQFEFTPARFGRRAVAFFVDAIIVAFLVWIFVQPILLLLGLPFLTLFFSIGTGSLGLALMIFILLGFVIVFGVYLFFTDRLFEGTAGKALMGIRVLDTSTSEPAGFWQYLFRETLGKTLSGLLVAGGYLLALFHSEKKALHDILFFTQVVETKEDLSLNRWALGLGLIALFFGYEVYDHKAEMRLAEKIKVEGLSAWDLQRKVSDSSGKAVVLSFWSPSCGPCRKQFDHFLKLKKKYEPQGLEMIHIAVEDESSEFEIKRALGQHGVDFLSYFRNEDVESFLNSIDPNWSGAIPFTVVYNANRESLYSSSGFLSEANLESLIQKALGI